MRKLLPVLMLLLSFNAMADIVPSYSQNFIEFLGGGAHIPVPNSADNDPTVAQFNGPIIFTPTNSGPGFGTAYGVHICGMGLRNSGEGPLFEPAMANRCHSQVWEGEDLVWQMNLTDKGLCVGCKVADALPGPYVQQARLMVKARGTESAFYATSENDTYFVIDAPAANKDGCFTLKVAQVPVAAYGRCGNVFGVAHQNEFSYGKYVVGVGWTYLGKLFSW